MKVIIIIIILSSSQITAIMYDNICLYWYSFGLQKTRSLQAGEQREPKDESILSSVSIKVFSQPSTLWWGKHEGDWVPR